MRHMVDLEAIHTFEGGTETVPGAGTPLGDRADMVYMNADVTRGAGEFVVTATGMATEVGHISGMLAEERDVTTPLTRQLGAPDQLLARAATVSDADAGPVPADGEFRQRYLAENQRLGEQGLRVMATARRDLDPAALDPGADLLPLVTGLELLAHRDEDRQAGPLAVADLHRRGPLGRGGRRDPQRGAAAGRREGHPARQRPPGRSHQLLSAGTIRMPVNWCSSGVRQTPSSGWLLRDRGEADGDRGVAD
jgi:magnesium-transporting ATPase (P-type)